MRAWPPRNEPFFFELRDAALDALDVPAQHAHLLGIEIDHLIAIDLGRFHDFVAVRL